MDKAIAPEDIVPMDEFEGEPISIDLVYANPAHPENIFGCAIYDPAARLCLHRDLARVVIITARLLQERHGWVLVLKDGLRPVEAQARMAETDIVQQNPHWMMEPNRLLSGPGQGAHPRGMAIDVSVLDGNGLTVDMGTVFDAMVPESARAYTGFSPDILQNRRFLEEAFLQSAEKRRLPLLALPSEWWDFRLPSDYHKRFAPMHDTDLPAHLKMCTAPAPDPRTSALAKSILLSL